MAKSDSDPVVERYRPDALARVITLSDFIFASSMTVMVLTIEIPEPGRLRTLEELRAYMSNELAHLGVYIVSFVLIALYWMRHLEHFGYYTKTDNAHLWRQLAFLASIVLIPFSSTFASNYPDVFATEVVYSVNMVAVGAFSAAEWSYATSGRRLVPADLSDETVREVRRGAMTEPVVALVALGVAWFNPTLWEPTFILAPVLYAAQHRARKWYVARKDARSARPGRG